MLILLTKRYLSSVYWNESQITLCMQLHFHQRISITPHCTEQPAQDTPDLHWEHIYIRQWNPVPTCSKDNSLSTSTKFALIQITYSSAFMVQFLKHPSLLKKSDLLATSTLYGARALLLYGAEPLSFLTSITSPVLGAQCLPSSASLPGSCIHNPHQQKA